jgi:hypothetical protein
MVTVAVIPRESANIRRSRGTFRGSGRAVRP